MKVITLTRGMTCVVDDDDYDELSKHKWQFNHGYACIYTKAEVGHRRIVYMHRQVLGASSKLQVDHINQNKLDNRRENLRICTQSQNRCNCKPSSRNSSGYKGVSWHEHTNKWLARTYIDGKLVYIGVFTSKEEAAKAYNGIITQLHGRFALPNKLKGESG